MEELNQETQNDSDSFVLITDMDKIDIEAQAAIVESSSEHCKPAVEQSASQVNNKITSYAVAEINGSELGYRKIQSSHIPKGWSNDPQQFEGIDHTAFAEFNIDPPTLPVLASDVDTTPRRYLVSNFGKLYFWIPSTYQLLYLTERYSLEGVLLRMNDDAYQLQTKSLEPKSLHKNQHQIPYLSLWFWQVPCGWRQDAREFEYLKHILSGQIYGLPLPVPILVNERGSGSPEFLMKCGKDFYLFYDLSHNVFHIDEPSELGVILSILDTRVEKDPKTTQVELLPEYGGPSVIAGDNVPAGWSNKIDRGVDCSDLFYKHRICGSDLLLFCDGSPIDTPKYLVEADESHYIWYTISNEIWHIEMAQGLQDILDILKDQSRKLTLGQVTAVRDPKPSRGEGGLSVQRSRD